MPLREDLLEPIPGENPSGESLRYDSVYDKIKEARRQEDDLSQGIWEREVKRADYGEVIRLAEDALATRSKDLQLAAWLTEALVYEEGISGVRQGIGLLRGLLDGFWETLHPELEDGDDAFMRSGILDWVGSYLEDAIKSSPLTKGGLSWYQYKESRTVGYEEDCGGDSDKLSARRQAIEDGKMPAEEFDAQLSSSPKAFYVELKAELERAGDALRELEALTDEKFTEEPPSFSGLRSALEEFGQTVHMLLAKKKEQEPDVAPAASAPPAAPETEPAVGPAGSSYEDPATEAAAPPLSSRPAALSAEPVDREDAFQRVVAAAEFLRRDDMYSPVPYLMLRALRWGEIRAGGPEPDPTALESPPSDLRQELKRQSLEGAWDGVLETAEKAMGLPCGRGWLDLQRYAVRACQELGSWYDPIANSILSELRALLADYPGLPEMTLMDDTATANRETRAWIAETLAPPPAEPSAEPISVYDEEPVPEGAPPDANDLAIQALRAGRPEEALGILTREIAQVQSGRERFRRRFQLAQICLSSGREIIAYPILRDLAAEMERRRLEEWESAELLAQPLVLLHRCMTALGRTEEEKQVIYERICRLDPVQAMSCG